MRTKSLGSFEPKCLSSSWNRFPNVSPYLLKIDAPNTWALLLNSGLSPYYKKLATMSRAEMMVYLDKSSEPPFSGSAVDRERLFTFAVRGDIWELTGDRFQWPQPGSVKPRTTRSILDRVPDKRYLCRQDNSILFNSGHALVRNGRSHVLFFS
jgi:hypothetical protein